MAKLYSYRARETNGRLQQGILTADDELSAVSQLRGKGWLVTEVKEKDVGLNRKLSFGGPRKVSATDLAIFTRQFSAMIDAGLPLISTLGILEQQTVNPRLRLAIAEISKAVQNGDSLSRAMSQQSGVFPSIMVSMVEAGELGGVLDEVMRRLALHFEKEHKLYAKVKGAMMYPIVVMCIAVLIIGIIMVVVVPKFVGMFQGMNIELPVPTQLLILISDTLKSFWWAILAALIALYFGFKKYAATKQGRPKIDRIKLGLPIIGKLAHKVAIARFCSTLGTLLKGGVGIIQALEVVKRVADNSIIENAVTSAQTSIKEGQGLSGPLRDSQVFDSMAVQMIAIGEETGQLDSLLEKVAAMFESDVEESINGMSKLIEPILIVFLGGCVGFIVISLFLPMFEIMNAVGGQ